MPALAIDTATETLSIALGRQETPMGEVNIEAGKSHLEMLLPSVHRLLGERGLTVRDLDLVCVGTGPGTFSGLRVGIATARALAQSLKIPIRGSSSLRALAAGMCGSVSSGSSPSPLLLPVIDARRGQVFSQLYRKDGGEVTPASEIFCLDPGDLLAKISQLGQEPVIAAGNGVLAYLELFEAEKAVWIVPVEDGRHRMRAVYHLPETGLNIAYDPRDLLAVLPVYVREPDADKTILLRKREEWQ